MSFQQHTRFSQIAKCRSLFLFKNSSFTQLDFSQPSITVITENALCYEIMSV